MSDNLLYYGDNLDILRNYVADESVDLIYLDPPFKSNQDYNVLFAEQDGSRVAAQIKAFEDTWHWDIAAVTAYQAVVEGGGRVAEALQAFHRLLGGNDMLAYLTMMAPRLVELRRVSKPTGSIYLHCDPTASHYLKVLMDAIFGPDCFRNEIVWERTTGRKSERQFGRVHDIIFFYSNSDEWTWDPPTVPQTPEAAKGHDIVRDPKTGNLYRDSDPTGAGQGQPLVFFGSSLEPPKGRHWMFDQEGIDRLIAEGRIVLNSKGKPRLRTPLEELPGISVRDVWKDIAPLNSAASERLGYPTQKPEILLDRILQASSNEGNTVLDPFCGCGTTIAAAQRLNRRWIGIDITHLAITVIRHRLLDTFGSQITKQYQVIGEPISVPDVAALAKQDRFQFQWWALVLVGARPTPPEQKKGADKGIDGRLYFFDESQPGKAKLIVFSVKSGQLKATDVRDLRGAIDREKAAIGVLITLEEPTQPMRAEAASAGSYVSPFFGNKRFSRLQIVTVEQLLQGRGIDMPPHENIASIGKRAPKTKGRKVVEAILPFDEAEDEVEDP